MGPSVKFVSAIKDAFFNKKNGGQFFSREKDQTGGGGGGGPRGFGKRPYFSRDFFFEPFPKIVTQIMADYRKGGAGAS